MRRESTRVANHLDSLELESCINVVESSHRSQTGRNLCALRGGTRTL